MYYLPIHNFSIVNQSSKRNKYLNTLSMRALRVHKALMLRKTAVAKRYQLYPNFQQIFGGNIRRSVVFCFFEKKMCMVSQLASNFRILERFFYNMFGEIRKK